MVKNKGFNIVIPDMVKPPADVEQEVFGPDSEIFIGQAVATDQISDDIWQNCEAILAYDKLFYDSDLLERLNKCKVIIRVGVGYDNVDLIETKKLNITVCNVPDYGTGEVADHTIFLLLSLARGLHDYTERVESKNWDRHHPVSFRLDGKTLGIIGLGRIGTAVAMRIKAFGIRIIFYDPYIKDGYDKALGVERVESLDDLARKADIVSIHAPLTGETNKMIGGAFFSKAKNGIVLINTARGAIIDLAELEKAMRKGTVKACGLDVLPIEPSDESQTLIVAYENNEEWLRGRMLVTPHIAFYSPQSYEEMRRKAAQEALRVLKGEKARNRVN